MTKESKNNRIHSSGITSRGAIELNGFQLSERVLDIDINVKICFMSAGEINREALREIHPSISLGCFIKKPVTIEYLIDRIMKELD